MKQNQPSHTAQHMASLRAAHQLLDQPLILSDPVALTLVGADGAAEIRAGGLKFNTRIQRHLRAFAVARNRVVEDELEFAVARGVRQFVILGAGMDTFAYRNPYGAQGLKVFEVDHPDTQTMKRQWLKTVNITPPEPLTFVPVNFEKDKLGDQLHSAGFQANQPTLFSWLGVSMYLQQEAIQQIFQFVQGPTSAKNVLVFDYMAPLHSVALLPQLKLRMLASLLALKGEPWRSYFEPAKLSELLKSIGFRQMQDLGPAEINARFFDGRSDLLKVGGPGHIMIART